MPKIRRRKLPKPLLTHLLARIRDRNISAEQIILLARWLDSEPVVPEGKWFKRFAGFTLCGEGELVEKRARKGNTFYGCSRYPKCKFTSAAKPIPEKCPDCGHEFLVERIRKDGPVIACPNKECDYERAVEGVAGAPQAV